VEHLSFVRDAIEGGVSPADAHRMLAERVSTGESLREPDADAPQVLILVAERNEHAAELVDYLLRTEGFAVEVATTPAEALERFVSLSPALVIVQLLLGGGAGIDLCHELKRRGAPAVLATSELRTEQEALAAGADAFLDRPLNSLALVSTVKDLLARSAMLRSARPVGV
jgi:DNA-binding response OmpR family regulator